MFRRAVILVIALASLAALAGCARGDTEPGASRLRSPSMTGAGMDGGIEAGEPASYLQHLP